MARGKGSAPAKETSTREDAKPAQKTDRIEKLKTKLVLTGADIVAIGPDAELIVGGKNYNTAVISEVKGIRAPQFRAINALCFHKVLDETKLNASRIRQAVEREYNRIDWSSSEVAGDPEFLRTFVWQTADAVREQTRKEKDPNLIKTRTFVNNVVEGFATSPEGIDQLRKRSVLVQVGILSVDMPDEVVKAVKLAYKNICKDAGLEDEPVAVRSSAAGEDSRKKAFAGLQDTYLNIVGENQCVRAYHWDCASAYNLRSMTYRREAILDARDRAELTGDVSITERAKEEWAIENTSLSVCIMRMINPMISGTAFSADTATGCRGTDRNDLVSIDASYGLGEAVVGGMVTPDKYYVFDHDEGSAVVVRQMGYKDKKIVYDEKGGTKTVPVSEMDAYRWSLSLAQAEEVANGVRAVSQAYGDCIMDTEFCIDSSERLWFVQARPETRWNEDLEKHPYTIFMRRKEVDPALLDSAEVVVEGNGASRGAGQGTVKFLRSALELNKINKGDILAAERTDPDMVPGMRIASGILADVGGDTSHAAITSRELGIPAIIGIQRLEALRALDGQEVTVDGSRGKIYRGLLPLVERGGEIDVSELPETKTKVGLILADVNQALFLSRLRLVPDFEVGLLRAEFLLAYIGAHPLALEAYDSGELEDVVNRKIGELESQLTQFVKGQMAAGVITLDITLRDYVGQVTGIARELNSLRENETKRGTDEVLAIHRMMHDLDLRLERYVQNATRWLESIKTSVSLEEHVACIMGYKDEMVADTTGNHKELKAVVKEHASSISGNPMVQKTLEKIRSMREEVAVSTGLQRSIEDLRSIPKNIRELLRSRGSRTGKEHYTQTLAQGLALFSMAFYGKPVVYRTTDFKTNEYSTLLGGNLFEQSEDNPMLGYRGVSRNIHDWEIEAFKMARGMMGGSNLQIMLPFVRTMEEARSMKRYLDQVHNMRSGEDGLKIILMAEIPSNAILAKEFIKDVDGFSIGSNDMTQMVLATDRDNSRLAHIYDEEDPAVVWSILTTIFTGQKYGKKVGFCGQGVSNSEILRGIVAIAGIVSASVVPDTYLQTKLDLADTEAQEIPVSRLGEWLSERYLELLRKCLADAGYEHIAQAHTTAESLQQWFDGEMARKAEQLRESLETGKGTFYRQEMEKFRSRFHKPVIYATWDWNATVESAMHQAGFKDFKEQEKALEAQRKETW